ncbi:MAG: chorismate mutase [Nanoarchaeota archaeon]|nr:chorismate mutase [Nanoarchaeota archaeon]MBU0977587.1 chorismate mutase [Nanoarchaeota archaeon]
MKKIYELREKIDELDEKIIKLVEERYVLCEEIWKLKRDNGLPLKDAEREEEIKEGFAGAELPKGFVEDFFELFFREVK